MQQPDFMMEPSKVLKSYLEMGKKDQVWFDVGVLGMALEIITRIKFLEDLPVTTEVGRQEAITVLQTLLTEMGISEIAYEWYERLVTWRRVRFLRVPDGVFAQRLEHAYPSDVPGGPVRLGQPDASFLASLRGEHSGALALPAGTDELPQERQSLSPDADATAS